MLICGDTDLEMERLKLDEFRKHHKLAADIARFIGKGINIQFSSKDRVVEYTCDLFSRKRTGLSLFDYYSQGIMEYRLTGGWGITTMGGVVIVNESDSWDTRILGWKKDDDNLKWVKSDNDDLPKGFKKLVDYKDTYLKPSKPGDELIWGINLGDKLKYPNCTIERDRKLEKQRREEMVLMRERAVAALQTGAEAAAAVADAATRRLQGK
jgi:hypothetical protein|tara:strand:+ start:64 stop:693 length:630 start_codon:yes stop_codon:yes gene_type:complete